MDGEFRYRLLEVKGTGISGLSGGQMTKIGRWVGGAVAAAALVGIGLWVVGLPVSTSASFARLPVRDQNVIIFNAAVDRLKANYHDPAYFQTGGWRELETEWREKVANSQGGPLLYLNELQNFATRFPDSHLLFSGPAVRAPPPLSVGANKVSSPLDPATAAQLERNTALFLAGPGFDLARIRRSGQAPFLVADVLRGSPAERAGVTPGWAVDEWNIHMDGSGVHYKAKFLRLSPAMTRELERTGMPIVATSQQQLVDLVATRSIELAFDYEPLEPRTAFETRKLANGVTYLRFDHFNGWGHLSGVLDAIAAAGPAGLVIDLRRNTGGHTMQMMRVNGRLLGDDVKLGQLHARGEIEALHSQKFGDGHYEGPLAVLIGPFTINAAEITAAAIQDHKRGRLIGRMTNGSVVTTKQFDLPDGGTMTIPVKDFMRSGERRIEGVGVQPDIWILPTLDDVRGGRDPVLERALHELAKPMRNRNPAISP